MMAAQAGSLLRWRTEATLIALAIIGAHVFTVSGTSYRTTLVRALITAGVLMAQRETRAWVVDHAHCLLTRHRLYTALEGVRADVGVPRLPILLWVRPCPSGERAYLWRRPGITAEMLCARTDKIAADCWAKEAHFSFDPRWPAVIIVDVVRRSAEPSGEVTEWESAWEDGEERYATTVPSRTVPSGTVASETVASETVASRQ
jgi:hypothetical protein